jgi:hypothetical protein
MGPKMARRQRTELVGVRLISEEIRSPIFEYRWTEHKVAWRRRVGFVIVRGPADARHSSSGLHASMLNRAVSSVWTPRSARTTTCVVAWVQA